jgi:hypothetical protein
MPLPGTYNVIISALGIDIQGLTPPVVQATHGIDPVDIELPPGSAGTLSTRTDRDTGIATVSPNHNIHAGELVDVYWNGGLRHSMTTRADNYVLSGNVAYGNTTTELGFLVRGNPTGQTGYVLSLNAHDSYFNLIKLDPAKTNGFENLVNQRISGLSFDPNVTYTIIFSVNGAALHGELYNSAGAQLLTIDRTDNAYLTGAVGAWAWRSANPGSISGTWTNLSLGPSAFPTVTAYPQAPATFAQSDGNRTLHIVDPSGQFPLVAGYAEMGTIGGQVQIDQGAGSDLPPQGTALVVAKQVGLDLSFDGNYLVLIGAIAKRGGLLLFRDSAGALVGDPVSLLADVPWGWAKGRGVNPLRGNAVASGTVSNGSAEGSATFKLTGLQHEV